MIVSMLREDLITALASTLPAAATSTKVGRPHLACVVLQMHGQEIRVYATNGHWMARYVLPVDVDTSDGAWEIALTLLPAKELVALLQHATAPRAFVDFDVARVSCGGSAIAPQTMDVPGNDFEGIFRAAQPATSNVPRPPEIGLAIEYLAAVCKAAKAAGGKTLDLSPGPDPRDPVLLRAHPAPAWAAVLMPVSP